jgi:hypothetical protein
VIQQVLTYRRKRINERHRRHEIVDMPYKDKPSRLD